MHINWSQDEDEPEKPKAEIYTDALFHGDLTRITGVQLAYGSGPITVVFYYEGNVDLAMREIVSTLGQAGAIHGSFYDSRSGVSWP